jgi:hypothetical protein
LDLLTDFVMEQLRDGVGVGIMAAVFAVVSRGKGSNPPVPENN